MSGLKLILDKYKLTGANYKDWLRNLNLALVYDKVHYVLDTPAPTPLSDRATRAERDAHATLSRDCDVARCLIIASLDEEHQRQYEKMPLKDIFSHTKEMYVEQSRNMRFDLTKKFFGTKMATGSSVGDHVLKMIGYLQELAAVGFVVDHELSIDIILQSLPPSYGQFLSTFNMNKLKPPLPELLNMLRTEETSRKNLHTPTLLVAKSPGPSKGKSSKKIQKKKQPGKKGKAGKKEKGKVPDKSGIECYFCHKTGHMKKDCRKFLATQKAKPGEASASGIFVVEQCLSVNSTTWVLDTGSGSHICNHLQGLRRSRRLMKDEMTLRMGNGAPVAASAVGDYHLALPGGKFLILYGCYYVPDMLCNIISVSILGCTGYTFALSDDAMTITLNRVLIGHGTLTNGIYTLDLKPVVLTTNNIKKRKHSAMNETFQWHCRLGHINLKRIGRLHKDGYLDPFKLESYDECHSCLKGKMTKSPFSGKGIRAEELLGLIHSDVCGPLSTHAMGNYSYFVTFTDDFSRYGYVFLIRQKSDVLEKFIEYKNEVEKQTGKSIKILRSDRGGEYLSNEFLTILKENGILSQVTPPYTPQLNGVSERRNRTLMDMVRSMMSAADLPRTFWGYALETATYLLNRVPSKSVSKTPYELWTSRIPCFGHIKPWGCPAYVKKQNPSKLETRSVLCKFVGYPRNSKGYLFYHTDEQKIIVARDAFFLEEDFLSKGNSGSEVDLEEIPGTQTATENLKEQEGSSDHIDLQPPRRSGRIPHPPERYGFLLDGGIEDCVLDNDEPTSYLQAIQSRDSVKWLDAMRSEMDSMHINKVWTLETVPAGVKPIGCKWIFKRKSSADRKDITFKARLVAKGFRQRPGVDYDETFSPVAMLKSIRILLAIAAYHNYEIWQMDVKTAFLNGSLAESVYMTQPDGFIVDGREGQSCKLHKSIYGLKQASRSWNLCFDEAIREIDFIKNPDEPCIYKRITGNAQTFLVLYVDDILLIGNDIPSLQNVKVWLCQRFAMKDLGEASCILGIQIFRDRSKRMLGLSQSKYIETVLKRFNMLDSKKGQVPMVTGVTLSKKMSPQTDEEKVRMTNIPYASAIGSIMYAMLCTRPDIAYALSVVSRYQSDPGERHWIAVKNILKYLRQTRDMFLIFDSASLRLEAYADSSFQTDIDDSKSCSGFVFTLGGGAVSWRSSKQETVADSTMEAEYIAANDAAKEAVWMRKFLIDLEVVPTITDPVPLYCDNNGAIALAKEPRSHQKSRHILRKYHLIREIINRGEIKVERVDSKDNIADPLTKALPRLQFEHLIEAYGLKNCNYWP